MTTYYKDTATTMEAYNRVIGNYRRFIAACNDADKPTVTVFDPLTKLQMDELHMIRELSKTLQIKKDEEILKQKQKLEEAEAAATKVVKVETPEATESTEEKKE